MSKNKLIEVVIDRTKWYRGRGSPDSKLMRMDDGKMCCLGFACLKLGATEDQITGEEYPEGTDILLRGLTIKEKGKLKNTIFSQQAAHVNDDQGLGDSNREKQLYEMAIESGFKFTFIN